MDDKITQQIASSRALLVAPSDGRGLGNDKNASAMPLDGSDFRLVSSSKYCYRTRTPRFRKRSHEDQSSRLAENPKRSRASQKGKFTMHKKFLQGVVTVLCFVAVGGQAATNCVSPPSGLVSWWPFDTTVNDTFGANNPSATNALSLVTAKVANGLALATNGFFEFAHSATLANQQFTLQAWVRPDGPGIPNDGFGNVIIGKCTTNGSIVSAALNWRATDSRFVFLIGNINERLVSSNSFPPGQFYSVTSTYDGTAFRLYVNGILQSQTNLAKTVIYSASVPWTIGCNPAIFRAGFPRVWNGVIDEAAIYNRALSGDEIAAIYAAGSAGMCKPACVPPLSGLVHWWGADGNTLDYASANAGVLSNGAIFAVGKVGQAFSLDGVDDFVDLPHTPTLFYPRTNSFTIGAWINTTNSGAVQRILSRYVSSSSSEFDLSLIGAGVLAGFIRDADAGGPTTPEDGGGQSIVGSTVLSDGNWHYVAMARDIGLGQIVLYVDGRFEASEPLNSGASGDIYNDTGSSVPITIGALRLFTNGGHISFFKGFIDEVQVYNRALPGSEIAAIYAAGSAGMCKPQCVAPPLDLVSWWPGDGNLADMVGPNNGVSVGNTSVSFAPGLVGEAMLFNKQGNTVLVSNSLAFSFGANQDLTVAAWVNLQNPQSGRVDAIAWQIDANSGRPGGGGATNGWFLDIDPDTHRLFFGQVISGVSQGFSSSNAVPLARWTHLVVTRQGSNGLIYIDGNLDASRPVPAGSLANQFPMCIGGVYDTQVSPPVQPNQSFGGLIDEFTIFRRALSGPEITAIFAVRNAGMCKSAPSCLPPPSGLVSWWPGDGGANDLVGTNHGSPQNGATFASGRVAQAFSFDGVDDYVLLPDVTRGIVEGTVEFWFKVASWNWNSSPNGLYLWAGTQLLPSSGTGGDGINFGNHPAYSTSGQLMFGIYDSSWHWAYSGITPETGAWYHVAGTWGSAGIRIYVNGILAGTDPYAGPAPPYTHHNLVGRSSWPNTAVNGLLDELAIYSRALSSNEIAAIYAAGSVGKCKPAISCVLPPSGLVGWWTGDGNADDLVGNQTGSLQNGATFERGLVGYAFSLDGLNDSVSIPAAQSLTFSNRLTVDLWVYPRALGGRLIDKITAGTDDGFLLDMSSNGEVRWLVGPPDVSSSKPLPLNTWTHLAGVFDGSALRLYFNGQLDTFLPAIGTVPNNNLPLRFGANSLNGDYFNGLLDEVTIYNRDLASNEIAAIYAAGSVGMCKPECISPPSGLVSWWGGEGAATDYFSTNNGALLNGATFAPAMIGDGFSFDGANDCVRIPFSPQLVSPQFSLEAWVMSRATVPAGQQVWIFGQNGHVQLNLLPGSSGDVRPEFAFFSSSGRFEVLTSPTSIPLGQFAHVVGTWDGTTQKFYVNGSLTLQSALATSARPNQCPFFIGGVIETNQPCAYTGQFLNGIVDEASFYNRALSGNDIAAIYAARSAGKCRPFGTNASPSIDPIADRSVNEGNSLQFTSSARDPDQPGQNLTFSLGPGAPTGANINPTGGQFTWAPSEAQGPGVYAVTLRVTDSGLPPRSASTQFMVTVNEVNLPPSLAPISPQLTNAGNTLRFTASASDPDLPANTLTFSLDPGAPSGAAINSTNGQFTWSVPPSFASGLYSATIRVTDNGLPSLGATQTVSLQVDNASPLISAVTVTSNLFSARVAWTTDEPATTQAEYGSEVTYGNTTQVDTGFVFDHSALITGLLPGTGYHFRVHSRDRAGNEAVSGDGTFATPFAPDLVVTNLNVSPTNIQSGTELTITWTNLNTGLGPTTTSWDDQLVISNSTTGQRLLSTTVRYDATADGSIPSGSSRLRQAIFRLPDGPPGVGTLTFLVIVDINNTVTEYNGAATAENNNSSTTDRNSTLAPYPDLVVESVIAPAVARFGDPISVTWTVRNQGPGTALLPWNDRLYFSRDDVSGDDSVLVTRSAADLVPVPSGASYTRTQTVALPLGPTFQPGTYFLLATADYANSLFESVETNNTRASAPLSLSLPPLPDLAVAHVSFPPTAVAGHPVQVTWMITNQNTVGAIGPWQDTISFATNSSGTNAQSLATISYAEFVPGNGALTRSGTVILPSTIFGDVYFVVQADSANQVFEGTSEGNNIGVSVQPISILAPDLVVESVTAPTTARFGDTVNVVWSVRNRGNGPALVSWSDRAALSSDAIPGGDTVLTSLNSGDITPLVAGASYTRTQAITLPIGPSFSSGDYFVLVTADHANSLLETNEANNTRVSAPIQLSRPPLPDLAVSAIFPPASATSGLPVRLVWMVTNLGTISATGTWNETISISNAASGALTLGLFTFTDELTGQSSVTRTQVVTLPFSGPAEEIRFLVDVDSQREIFEGDESNNLGTAGTATAVLLQVKLQVPTTQISESAVNPIIRGTLTRNGPVTQPLVVLLANSDPTELRVTNNVTIAAGSSVAMFDIQVLADGVVDGPQTVTIGASASGYQSDSAQVTVLDSDLPRLTLMLATNIVREGRAVAATITRSLVTSNSLIVQMQSSRPAQVSVPATVEIPSGSNAVSLVLLASDDDLVELPTDYTITASAPGFANSAVNLTVLDDDLPHVTVSLANHMVSEGAGPQATSATITRDVVTARQLVLDVISTDPTAAVVPARVAIPSGQASISFPVVAVDDGVVDGPQETAIRAFILASGTTTRLAEATPDVLTVTDDDGAALRLVVNQKIVREGLNPATTGTVSRNTPATNDLLVALTSSRTNEAAVPPTAVISNGLPSATFNIASVADGTNDGSQTVVVMASSPGYASAADTLLVTDTDLPDLTVSSVTVPASGETETFATVNYRIANQGLVSAPSNFLTRVFLSPDPVVGDDTPISAYRFDANLPVGQYFEQSLQIQLPQQAGNYWVVVTTDTEQLVVEGLENNNTAVSRMPISVGAGYAATVHTDVDATPTGTPIPMRGRATNNLGAPVESKPVNIHIRVRGTERVVAAITDAGGNFEVVWQPLPGEAGTYEIFATHPGVAQAPVQDTFSILGMRASPASTSLLVVERSSVVGTVRLDNLSDQPLTGLAVSVVDKPTDLGVALSLINTTLPGLGAVTFGYAFTANSEFAYGTVHLRVTTAEGVTADVYFGVSVEALRPRLVAIPGSLSGGMARGRQRTVEFDVANVGGIPTGPLTVALPGVPWMQLVSTNPMPSLAPGETNRVTLLLTPVADLPLGPYTGSLALNAAQTGVNVPFNFRALSEAKGDLLVRAEDEYTYYAEGAPRIAGASVVVHDGISHTTVATGITDTNGAFFAPQLMEGFYELEVTADGHSAYRQNVLLTPGQTNEVLAFLARQTVQYVWTVEPVEIEDRYEIHIDTVFETAVPVPVVVIEPALIDLSRIAGDSTQIDFRISNHGLIDAREFKFSFENHPLWEIKPLLTDLGVLPAQSSLTVPVTVRRLQSAGARAAFQPASSGGSGPCAISGSGCWSLPCGLLNNFYCSQVSVINPSPACTPTPSSGGGGSGNPPAPPNPPAGGSSGGDSSGGGTPFVNGPVVISPPQCDCFFSLCVDGSGSIEAEWLAQKLAGALTRLLPQLTVEDPDIQLGGSWEFCSCCKNGRIDYEGEIIGTAEVEITLKGGPNFSVDLKPDNVSGWHDVQVSASGLLGVQLTINGSVELELTKQCLEGWELCGHGSLQLQPFAGAQIMASVSAVNDLDGQTYSGMIDGQLGITGSLTASANGCGGGNITTEVCGTLTANSHFNGTVTAGGLTKTISFGKDTLLAQAGCSPQPSPAPGGFMPASPPPQSPTPILETNNWFEVLRSDTQIRGLLNLTNRAPAGICTQVRIRLDQQAVVSRDAFKATLEIINSTPTPLTTVDVDVVVRDSAGQDRTALFAVREPTLTGLTAVDGTGRIEGSATGRASWLIIPTQDAAPEAPAEYTVSGTLRYVHDGLPVTVPLAAVSITVLPNPRLHVKYFHERDVFSDDPFTDVLEPSVPFSLAVMVENKGRGTARNFRITSAQPHIVENERGLLVDFRIIATEVAGQNVTPSLTVNLGTIEPGQNAIGRWLLTSTIQGHFTDYQATFEHIDGLGNAKLSLIEDLSIHEMIHLVRAAGSFEDGKPDFLVNDHNEDARDLPDTLYLSNGSTNSVQIVELSSVFGTPSPGNPTAQLTAPMPLGWAYLRVPEPSNGQLRLSRVRRSDGVEIACGTNAWTTDRTFIGMGRQPLRENIFHLLDYNSTGDYTLIYTNAPAADTNPPVSSVAQLAPRSYPNIPVNWLGQDEPGGSAIAFFDVFVSVNGGPFTRWLERTTLNGSVYPGVFGNAYAFYSVATDNAGNRELPPTAPDAQTLANFTNSPPVLAAVAIQTVPEGATVIITNLATDPDLPSDTLTFSLGPGAPSGMIINHASGLITWVTGEAHGPSTNLINVSVRDNGTPSLSDSKAITVIVTEVNQAPSLATISNRTIREGSLLLVTNIATDTDFPAQKLTFALGSGAPLGASIDPDTGVFRWRPTEFQGPSTNQITVIVSDGGIGGGGLSATQRFTVSVQDVLNDFVVGIGSTNLLRGGGSSIPLRLITGIGLKDVSFAIEAVSDLLTNFTLQAAASEIQLVSLQRAGSNRYLAQLQTRPGQVLQGLVDIATLSFDSVSNQQSVIVPIHILQVGGTRDNDVRLDNGIGGIGRVFLIGDQPILDAGLTTNRARWLTLYGQSAKSYGIESKTNLAESSEWNFFGGVQLVGTYKSIDGVNNTTATAFYRAYEVKEVGPPLSIRRNSQSIVIDWTMNCVGCVLEETTDLRTWTTSALQPQLQGDRYQVTVPGGNHRFYRLRVR